jgi:hypothetical protein
MKKLFTFFLIGLCTLSFAQSGKKLPKEQIVITSIDSTAFNFYYWITADRQTEKKTEKINIMSEKKVADFSLGDLTLVKIGDIYFKMTLKTLEKIKMDSLYVKTDQIIVRYDDRTITGAGKVFYYSDCLSGSFIKKSCTK